MYKVNNNRELYTPERLEGLKLNWLEIYLDNLRKHREIETDFNRNSYEHLKIQLAREAEPFTAEEQKKINEFIKKMETLISFWYFPDKELEI